MSNWIAVASSWELNKNPPSPEIDTTAWFGLATFIPKDVGKAEPRLPLYDLVK